MKLDMEVVAIAAIIVCFFIAMLVETDAEKSIEKAKQHTTDEQHDDNSLRDVCGGIFINGMLPAEPPADC